MSFFKRPATHYGKAPEPETPYQKAAQVWDERLGSARVQARSLDLCAATAPPEIHQERPRARANSAAQSLRSWWAFGSCCSSDDPGER